MSEIVFRAVGRLDALAPEVARALFDRATSSDDRVHARVAEIIARVRRDGDAALRALAREYDGVALGSIEVDRAHSLAALDALDAPLRRAMERAIANIATAHRAFLPETREIETEPGVVVGRRPDALERVGVYAPGGRAAYPSSVLMGVVPARVAGVREIVVCSPPERDTGRPSPVVLAAAELAGASRVYALGGAGAIAAMAHGTGSVQPVQRIVGPGNAYVAEAKVQVSGSVAIDAPAGPSELLVIADYTADATAVAREMLAQAEHDPQASVVLIAADEASARRIAGVMARLLPLEPRRAIIEQALAARGGLLWKSHPFDDDDIDFANRYAPEHLLLAVEDPDAMLPSLRNAGTIFLGASSSVAFGDYMTGANHVLPTGRAAHSYSGLSVLDFIRWTTYQRVTPGAAARLARDVGVFADAERLFAHAAAARAWIADDAGPRIVERESS
ncbi:MAG: histidinol dehydrogenase [Gemmatimonadaceae bacterium]